MLSCQGKQDRGVRVTEHNSKPPGDQQVQIEVAPLGVIEKEHKPVRIPHHCLAKRCAFGFRHWPLGSLTALSISCRRLLKDRPAS